MTPSALALLRGAPFPPLPGGADSVLVEGERIARVGPAAQVMAAAPRGARVVEAGGRTLSAGFHDAHFHFLQAGLKAARPDLGACRSLEEVLEKTIDAARAIPGREPLLLEGWDETSWETPGFPTRELLDAALPERAVVLRRVDDHTAVANGRALELLAPFASATEVDPRTGLCREGPVLRLDELFPPGEDEVEEAFRAAERLCLRLGITTASDFLAPRAVAAYARRFASATSAIRLHAWACTERPGDFAELRALERTGRFRFHGIKLFADGSIGARRAALFEDYADRPGERGFLAYGDAELGGIVRRAHEAGLAVAIHAIGDRAIAQALDAFAALPPEEIRARGHRIEHFELPRPGDIDRATALGVRPCVQPNFVGRWAGPGGLYERALGPARLARMNPLATLLRRGTGVFFGSDGMPASPLYGIRSACAHPVEQERLSLEEAWRLATEAPARAVGEEDGGGRIVPGAPADLLLAPFPPEEAAGDRREEVDLVLARGRPVHGRVSLETASGRC